MKKDAFVRISGWSLIVGAIVFLPGVSAMMLYDTQYAINNWINLSKTLTGLSSEQCKK